LLPQVDGYSNPLRRGPRSWRGFLTGAGRAFSAVGLLLLALSCRDATQVVLNVRTDLPCDTEDRWKGVAVYVGKPGEDVESTSPTLVTTECDKDGHVGSLVVVPSGAKDASLGIRVVAGVRRRPEDCADHDYQGCVVARRALHYTPHGTLDLDIDLAADCLSIGCDADNTCAGGSCVATPSVALSEAPVEPAPVSGPSVRCGDGNVRCPTEGNVCCLRVNVDAGVASGDCRPAQDCPPDGIVLGCDEDSDCPPGTDPAIPGVCALSYTVADPAEPFKAGRVALSSCRLAIHDQFAGNNYGLALCEDRKSCGNGRYLCEDSSTATDQLPGYFLCRMSLP
jgi:hypothetical protein